MLALELEKLPVDLVRLLEARMVHSLVTVSFLVLLVLVVEMLVKRLEKVLVLLEGALLERHYDIDPVPVLDLLRQALQNHFSQLMDRDGTVDGECDGQRIALVRDYVNLDIRLSFRLGQRQLDVSVPVV